MVLLDPLLLRRAVPHGERLFADGTFTDVTMTVNTGGWVFDDAEPRYTIGLGEYGCSRPPVAGRTVSLRAGFPHWRNTRPALAGPPSSFQ